MSKKISFQLQKNIDLLKPLIGQVCGEYQNKNFHISQVKMFVYTLIDSKQLKLINYCKSLRDFEFLRKYLEGYSDIKKSWRFKGDLVFPSE
jgi:hypothetical protein